MAEVTRVVVTDVDISFWNMVKLILTFAFASIPAALILAFVTGLFLAAIAGQ